MIHLILLDFTSVSYCCCLPISCDFAQPGDHRGRLCDISANCYDLSKARDIAHSASLICLHVLVLCTQQDTLQIISSMLVYIYAMIEKKPHVVTPDS